MYRLVRTGTARPVPCALNAMVMARNYGRRIGTTVTDDSCHVNLVLRYRCKKCKGKKLVKEKTRNEIFVERGMADRERIVLSQAGDQLEVRASLDALICSA